MGRLPDSSSDARRAVETDAALARLLVAQRQAEGWERERRDAALALELAVDEYPYESTIGRATVEPILETRYSLRPAIEAVADRPDTEVLIDYLIDLATLDFSAVAARIAAGALPESVQAARVVEPRGRRVVATDRRLRGGDAVTDVVLRMLGETDGPQTIRKSALRRALADAGVRIDG